MLSALRIAQSSSYNGPEHKLITQIVRVLRVYEERNVALCDTMMSRGCPNLTHMLILTFMAQNGYFMLPNFNSDGLLPPGDYSLTLDQLKESHLVTGTCSEFSDTWDQEWRTSLVERVSILRL